MSMLTIYRKKHHLSEREFAQRVQVSRETLRKVEHAPEENKIRTLTNIADAIGAELLVQFVPTEDCLSDFSSVAVSQNVIRDSFESWKIHFMNFVDEYRRSLDYRLLLLPPVQDLDRRLKALLSGITSSLCHESGVEPPSWCEKELFLDEPWFLSGMESLKASAILESPLPFRRHNIFVHNNFLNRV
jgi:transcriptional regulator with XRE-family HTH domain